MGDKRTWTRFGSRFRSKYPYDENGELVEPSIPVESSIPFVYFEEDDRFKAELDEYFETHQPCCGVLFAEPCVPGCSCYGCYLRAKDIGQISENGPKR